MEEYGKIPPQAIDLEEAVLGSMLLEPDKVNIIKSMLPAEAFYKEAHQWIYKAILQLNHRGSDVDILTVTEKLRALDKLEDVGGAVYVASLSARIGSAPHIKNHAAIVYEKHVSRQVIRIGNEMMERGFDESADPLDSLKDFEKQLSDVKLHFLGLVSTGVSVVEAADKSIEDFFTRENNYKNGILTGMPSTFKKLNKITGGYQPEQLIILAGRPGMGKTSVVISELMTAAQAKKKVFMFSLEMTSARLMDKVIVSLSQVDFSDFKRGTLSDEDKKRIEDTMQIIEKWDVTFNENMIADIDQIHATAKAKKDRDGLDMIIIDYLQLMRSRGVRKGNREEEVATISRGAKMMAVDLNVPVILLSQLNRGVEARGDKRPMLSDLRESGAIEQDADIVMFVYRDSEYNEESDPADGEIIVEKHREGPTGKVLIKMNESLTRFCDADDTLEPFTPF